MRQCFMGAQVNMYVCVFMCVQMSIMLHVHAEAFGSVLRSFFCDTVPHYVLEFAV